MKKLQLALIGYGFHGPKYGAYLRDADGETIADVVALVDVDNNRLRDGAKDFSIPEVRCFKRIEGLLHTCENEIDGVIISTPADNRGAVIKAVMAGKHVFCENPLATTIHMAQQICRVSRDSPEIVVTVNEQWRFLPSVKQMVRMCEENVGRLRFIEIGGKGRPAVNEEIPRIGSHLLSVIANAFEIQIDKNISTRFGDDIIAVISGYVSDPQRRPIPIVGKFIVREGYDVGSCYIRIEGDKGGLYAIGGLLELVHLRKTPCDSAAYPHSQPCVAWKRVPVAGLREANEDSVIIVNTEESRNAAMTNPAMNPTFWLIRQWILAIHGKADNPSPPDDYLGVVHAVESATHCLRG